VLDNSLAKVEQLEHASQVGFEIQAIQLCRADEAIDRPCALAARI
jgi:hypothetical protein